MAWLHAAPRPRKPTQGEDRPPSRIDQIRASGGTPPLPPNPAPYLFDRLMEIGPVEVAGMDRVPLGWATLQAWSAMSGITLDPWEARLLRRLSAAYLAESREAEDMHRPAPWSRTPTTVEARAAADALKAFLRQSRD